VAAGVDGSGTCIAPVRVKDMQRRKLERALGPPYYGDVSAHARWRVLVGLTLKTDPIRVLFVEDDKNYREIVGDELSYHGFAVRSFADGHALLGSLDAGADADVILLDWAMPEISGIDLLAELRRHGVNLPVVFLTSHATPAYEQFAFERGALDFIDKVRGTEVLVRRLRLVAKAGKVEPGLAPEERLVCGKLVLGSASQRAYWNAVDVGLTVNEYDIVHLLVSNAGRYRTYRDIYDCMYYTGFVAGLGDDGYRTNVRAIIKRIRRKFCGLDPTFGEIENASGLGYRWRPLAVSPEGAAGPAPDGG
jgi:two-component system, OmpR family, response regulator ChvI